ncbi:MAG TPA: DUF3168 domain-containing protein [Vicinamibacterales bacterium]|nr:DUF3168 domain-containing protein [Vicinamibacterales bacterium]
MLGAAQSALVPLATAIYGALNGTTGFTGLSPIYNDVPQGTPRPYTVLEGFTEAPWNTMHEYGKTCMFQLHIVSEAEGDQEAFNILSAAIGVLDYSKPAVANHKTVQVKYESLHHWSEEAIAGVKVRHVVGMFRADLAQSTS